MKSAKQELELLLDKSTQKYLDIEQNTFDEIGNKVGYKFVLFGIGRLGRQTLKILKSIGMCPVVLSDNNASLWGSIIDEIPVIPPHEAVKKYGKNSLFIITIWNSQNTDSISDRITRLISMGCKYVTSFVPLFWKYPELFLPYYYIDLPSYICNQRERIINSFELFRDNDSRTEFLNQVKMRLLGDFSFLSCPSKESIFYPKIIPRKKDDIIVDCGAFDGDTIAEYLLLFGENFRKIIAYEPDPINYKKLIRFINTLPPNLQEKIKASQIGVGDSESSVSFNSLGDSSSGVGLGNIKVKMHTLDNLLQGISPAQIKMDIEGYEFEALLGARKAILESNPSLSICVYHKPKDLWEIPLLVSSLGIRYDYYLLPHKIDGWDLVFYATKKD
jgi:FkbM family methyltransferase